jgi:hypothetical protein
MLFNQPEVKFGCWGRLIYRQQLGPSLRHVESHDYLEDNGTTLVLTGELTGSSNGTPTSTGSLSDGVVVGKWTLDSGTSASNCNASSGSFVICQGTATCTIP